MEAVIVHLDLVHIGHGDKAVQLHVQMLRHALHGAGHIAQLANAGRLDDDAASFEAPLLPKLRGHFAEFLNKGSPVRLRILSSPTCVGFRYGRLRIY